MWNTVILPILTSLAATGLGIFFVWLYNRKGMLTGLPMKLPVL